MVVPLLGISLLLDTLKRVAFPCYLRPTARGMLGYVGRWGATLSGSVFRDVLRPAIQRQNVKERVAVVADIPKV